MTDFDAEIFVIPDSFFGSGSDINSEIFDFQNYTFSEPNDVVSFIPVIQNIIIGNGEAINSFIFSIQNIILGTAKDMSSNIFSVQNNILAIPKDILIDFLPIPETKLGQLVEIASFVVPIGLSIEDIIYYKIRGYYTLGSVYEIYVTTNLTSNPPSGHILVDKVIVDSWII